MPTKNYFLYLIILGVVFYGCSKKSETITPPPPPIPTIPGCTINTFPANGAFVTTSTITFTWAAVNEATSYDLYVGATAASATLLGSNLTSTAYTYTVPVFASSQPLYWYVQPKNAIGVATGCNTAASLFTITYIADPVPFGFYVVGYFPSYRNVADVPDVKFRMTNTVVYAFFGVNSSGTLSAPASPVTTITALAAKAKANNAKVFLGINDGTGDGKTNFKNMAATAAGRNNFVKDVMNKVRQYNLDGVDMDWEFPTTSDGTDITFTLMMKELSDSLHRDARYYLSCAVTAGKYAGGIRDAIKTELFGYVDFFNVMAYDDFNTTVPYRHHSDYALAQTCLNYWLNTRGMPASKCVLGLPAYGRPSGITQTGTIKTYKDILTAGGSPQSDSAVVSATGFPSYTIYYNGQSTIKKKAKLAKDIANGVMLWEKWQDAQDGNSLLKAACDTVGRTY